MVDFSEAAVKEFWLKRQDSVLYRIIASMDNVETWTLDGDPEVEAAVLRLANLLETAKNFELAKEAEFVNVLSALKSSRALRILQYVDSKKPGTASKLLVWAEQASKNDEHPASFFLNRNLVFERMQLLARILQSERVRWVHHLLESSE